MRLSSFRQTICTKVADFRLKICIFAFRNIMKMRIHGSTILLTLMALVLFAGSCKKEEETKEYMNGSVSVSHKMPPYVKAGDKFQFTPGGVTAPDGTAVAYYFTAPITGKKDTLKNGINVYEYEVPDTLGTFTISCIAYPVESSDKYYVSSGTINFVVVSDDPLKGSITGIGRKVGDSRVTIDGRIYYAGAAGGKEWLRSNLSIVRLDAAGNEVFGHSFQNSPAMRHVFGAYYTWEEAQTACPEGWHLPSEAEWVALLKDMGAPSDLQPLQDSPCGAGKLMVKALFNGVPMWDYYRGVTIKDAALSAIPTGYAQINEGQYSFYDFDNYSIFWTSDEFEGKGVYRYIFEQYDNVFVGHADKSSFAASVRCVR